MKKRSGFFMKISELSAVSLVLGPFYIAGLGLLAMFGIAAISSKPLPPLVAEICICWMSFWFIISGLGMVIKQEIPRPGHRSITGGFAVIVGILWMAVCGSLTLVILLSAIS